MSQMVSPVHTATNTWESNRDVLDTKTNATSAGAVVSAYDYSVNNVGQRTGVATSGSAFAAATGWTWGYDNLGQVNSAAHATNTALNQAYQYDDIGNRKQSSEGVAPSLLTTDYTPNLLNQYSAITGANAPASAPAYDEDGNQLSGSSGQASGQTFVWDGENRLSAVKDATGNVLVSYTYDAQSRRVRRSTSAMTTLYVYDGWNCVAEYQAANNQPSSISLAKTYIWGLDLPGSLQGAGGVGGLLAVTQISNGQVTTTAFPTYDGNGNVSEYLDASAATAAHFEYDAFGKVISSTGSTASFDYRFSTKPQDAATGWLYYGYRYYDPTNGKWVLRDPIEENGGTNLYWMVWNDCVNKVDILGLRDLTASEKGYADDLETQAAKYESKNPELAKALRAVKQDYTELIDGLKGRNDPARVQFLNRSLEAWTDAGNVQKYKVEGDNYKCSLLVRRSLGTNAPEWTASDFVDEPNKKMLIVYKIEGKKVDGQPDRSQPEVKINVRVPKLGDIVAFGMAGQNGTNTGHVGIYLGSGLFLNATLHVGPAVVTWPDTAGHATETGGVGIKFVPELQNSGHDIIIYRSPDRK